MQAGSRSMNRISDRQQIVVIAVLAALLMQTAAWELLIYAFQIHHFGYGFMDISDIGGYHEFADRVTSGLHPYRDFAFEYPPLAEPLMALPRRLRALGSYEWVFAGGMMVLGALAAMFVAATVARLWPGLRRPLVAGVACAAGVLAIGPIVANRFDVAVALDMAIFAYCLARRWWWPAAAVLGLGFALKLTPAIFLPLVFLLAARMRPILVAAAAFLGAAMAPFLPHLLRGGRGLLYVFNYHSERPVQLESLLASPYLVGRLLGSTSVAITNSHGSQGIVGPGTVMLARLSPWLMVACLAALYALLWRRRRHLRDHPADVSLVLLAMVLILMCTSKVLSPQFLIWTIPFLALVSAGGGGWRLGIGLGLLAVLVLTHVGFPARYWDLVAFKRSPILLIVARNLGLLVVAILTVVQVYRCSRPRKGQAGASPIAPGEPHGGT
jgi:hypothetical protein